MGTFVLEQPVRLTKGEFRRVEGGSIWSSASDREAADLRPDHDQFIVLSAARYKLDSARCLS
ncbi:MAG TPA: hypothetical protein VGO80_21390 [Solirubrobacteraceae bacterium]|jgi:hypothetical protein|nr:hypothetical protein [Solirubrobacteraceae bacterium]